MRRLVIAAFAVLSTGSLFAGDIITGTGPGSSASHLKVFDSTGTLKASLLPFGSSYTGGITVSSGSSIFTVPGSRNIIVGATSSVGGHVKVLDATTFAEIHSFLAFPGFNGSISVAGGNIDSGPFYNGDIIVGAGPGAPGGHVKVFKGDTGAEIRSFLAFPGFNGGVSVGNGVFGGGNHSDIIVGAGPGGPGGHVKCFDGATLAEIKSFQAFPGFNGGVSVAGGRVTNSFFTEIVVGAGPGGQDGHVKVFDGTTLAEIRSFKAFPGYNGGVRVATAQIDGDVFADIIVGTIVGGHVKVFSGATGAEIRSFFPYPGFNGGVSVGGRFP